jgi:mRNA interferase RelE/StbE
MSSYEILWKKSAARELRNIDSQYIPKIIITIESLSENPFPKGYRKLKNSKQSYRIRIGEYRVIYQVDNLEKIVTVFHIRHRRDAYQ